MMLVDYFLEANDDTYIYGDLMFKCEFDVENGKYIEPFIRTEGSKTIKFYRNKQFFVVYEDSDIREIIKTMTCWSDDVIAYKILDGNAYKYDEVYHGRPIIFNKDCAVDFSIFIRDNGL